MGLGLAAPQVVEEHAQAGRRNDLNRSHPGPSAAQPEPVGAAHHCCNEGDHRAAKEPGHAENDRAPIEDDAGQQDDGRQHPYQPHGPEQQAHHHLVGQAIPVQATSQ